MATTLLIVDARQIFRDLLSAFFQKHDFVTQTAGNGVEAMGRIRQGNVDVVVMDLDLPGISGLTLLERIQQLRDGRGLPTMILTDVCDKASIVRAATLGVRDYVLKSGFDSERMVARIRELVRESAVVRPPAQPIASASPPVVRRAVAPAESPSPVAPARMAGEPSRRKAHGASAPPMAQWPRILSRDRTLQRLDQVTGGKTLAGVVAQVIAVASSPDANLADLVRVIQGDPILASRVLQLANSAATGGRKRVTNIEDAARTIGVRGIQNMALSIGIFGTFPPDELDGFNSLRCWQHSFAVGELMALIMRQRDPQLESIHHLVGLCHDLGEILLRQHFIAEYESTLQFALTHNLDVHQVETVALGIRHPEMVSRLLNRIGLPADVVNIIREFHERQGREQAAGMSVSVQILHVANLVAHGMLLAASPHETVRPISRTEWRHLTTDKAPPTIDPQVTRGEILAATNVLARLPVRDEQRLIQPLLPRRHLKIAYVRPECFIAIDPLAYALGNLCEVTVFPALPPGHRLPEFDGMVVAGLRSGVAPALPPEIIRHCQSARSPSIPVLVLVGNQISESRQGATLLRSYPLRLIDLQSWLDSVASSAQDADQERQARNAAQAATPKPR